MQLSLAAPPLAAGFDWLDGLVPLVFAIFWIVSQVVNLVRRMSGEPPRPRVEPVAAPRRRPPAVDAGEKAGDVRGDLERQIEEFLARSQRGGPVPPRPVGSGRVEPMPPRPVRPRSTPLPAARRPPPPLPPPLPQASGSSVAARHFDPLGAAGDDIAEHVQDAFKRKLTRLGSSLAAGTVVDAAERPQPAANAAAADLARAVRDPQEIRRLILLREVLERPVHRWE